LSKSDHLRRILQARLNGQSDAGPLEDAFSDASAMACSDKQSGASDVKERQHASRQSAEVQAVTAAPQQHATSPGGLQHDLSMPRVVPPGGLRGKLLQVDEEDDSIWIDSTSSSAGSAYGAWMIGFGCGSPSAPGAPAAAGEAAAAAGQPGLLGAAAGGDESDELDDMLQLLGV
jgi:hypothetical protein